VAVCECKNVIYPMLKFKLVQGQNTRFSGFRDYAKQ
jgi:hypothetical protein